MTEAQELKSLIGSPEQRQTLLEEVRRALPASLADKIARILELATWLLALLELKNLSIAKLRELCFGATTESARNVCGKDPKSRKKTKAKGHGRNPHRHYTGARRVRISHPTLRPGQQCPGCKRGKLRPRKQPAIAIAVRAQPPVGGVWGQISYLLHVRLSAHQNATGGGPTHKSGRPTTRTTRQGTSASSCVQKTVRT